MSAVGAVVSLVAGIGAGAINTVVGSGRSSPSHPRCGRRLSLTALRAVIVVVGLFGLWRLLA